MKKPDRLDSIAIVRGAVPLTFFMEFLEQVANEVFPIWFRHTPRQQSKRKPRRVHRSSTVVRHHRSSRPGVSPRVMLRIASRDAASSRRPAASGR